MSNDRCVVVVGGSHSVHVKVPSRMMREAGYRVVLGDIQPETDPSARDVFDAIYPLSDWFQRLLARRAGPRGDAGAVPPGDRPVEIDTPTRRKAYLWRLLRGRLEAGHLLKVIRHERPGLVHFQSMTAAGMCAYYLLKRMGWCDRGERFGLLAHLWGYAPRFAKIRRREIRVLKEFDHIHTSSPTVARIYRENYEIPPEQISVFVRGIDLDTFRPRDPAVLARARREWGVPEDGFVIMHNRHLHPMYRVDIAADVFIELARRRHDVFLILVRGVMRQEDYEQQLLAKLREHSLEASVALMPQVLTPDQMATALQLSHCSVNCVPFDAFPVSILESMYCRSVPVVRDLESYSQFVKDGQTAFAVGSSVEQYVACIEKLITDPPLRERMAQEGVELVRTEGSVETYRRRILDLVERCWHDW